MTFVSTCQGKPEYWTNDTHTARDIVRLLPADIRPRVRVGDRVHRTEELIALLGESDLVTVLPRGAVEACRRMFDELAGRGAALADGVMEQRGSAWAVVDRLRGLGLPTRSSSCVRE